MSSAELLRICDPQAYFSAHLDSGFLPDGRSLTEFRPFSLQMGVVGANRSRGSAMVRQGGATVVVFVRPELCVPVDGRGFVVVNFDSDKPQLIEIAACLRQLIADDAIISRRDLVIVTDKLAWALYVQLQVLDIDGPLIDAVISATVASILHIKLPKIALSSNNDEQIFDLRKAKIIISDPIGSSIPLADCPVSSTFILTDKGTLVCDPGDQLLQLYPASVNVVMGRNGCLFRLCKSGGLDSSSAALDSTVHLASKRQKSVESAIEQALSVCDK